MTSLTLDEYQALTAATAVYPDAETGSMLALAYVGLGLGEVGEIQGKIKKILRDDQGRVSNEKRIQIASEVGDALWYLARLAKELGFTFEEVAYMNLEKLADRKSRGVLTGSGDER